MTTLSFTPFHVSTMTDPVVSEAGEPVVHWTATVRAKDLPSSIPNDPNARSADIAKPVYRKVIESLRSNDGLFHLKNKGITIIASQVREAAGGLFITFDEGDGIVDGGHTYSLINQSNLEGTTPERQYVTLFIRTAVPAALYPEISRGLNTAIQVKETSLSNLGGHFQWLKDTLEETKYAKQIAWQENQKEPIKVDYLIKVLTCFNTRLYPVHSNRHPIEAYSSKAKVFRRYQQNIEDYRYLTPIVEDIFTLHDHVINEAFISRRRGKLLESTELAEPVRTAEQALLFSDDTIRADAKPFKLQLGALLPILGALRQFVVTDAATGTASWDRPFADVKRIFDSNRVTLLSESLTRCGELGRNPQSLGKDRSHWEKMHSIVDSYAIHARPQNAVLQMTLRLMTNSGGRLVTPMEARAFVDGQESLLTSRRAKALRAVLELSERPLNADETAALQQHKQSVELFDAALEAIKLETYGSCQECAEPIALERLERTPHALACISCASEYA